MVEKGTRDDAGRAAVGRPKGLGSADPALSFGCFLPSFAGRSLLHGDQVGLGLDLESSGIFSIGRELTKSSDFG